MRMLLYEVVRYAARARLTVTTLRSSLPGLRSRSGRRSRGYYGGVGGYYGGVGLRSTSVIFAAFIMAACGPRYTIHNGGLVPVPPDEKVSHLQRTEAVGSYSTDYAPPELNDTYGGPTNRVHVSVPADLSEHEYVSLSTSGGLVRVGSSTPVRGRTGADNVTGALESVPAQSLAGTAGPTGVAGQYHGVGLATSDGLAGGGRRDESSMESQTHGLSGAASQESLAARGLTGNSLGLSGADALSEPAQPSAPLAAGVVTAQGRYETSKAAAARQGADVIGSRADALVSAEKIDSTAARDIGKPDQPLGAQMSEELSDYAAATAVADVQGPDSAKGVTGEDTGKLFAHREVAAEVADSNARIAVGELEPLAVHIERGEKESVTSKTGPGGTAGSKALAGRVRASDLLSLADSEALRFAENPRSFLKAATAEALNVDFNVNALAAGAERIVTTQVAMVSPPWLSVLLEGRLVGASGVEKLVAKQVLPAKPRSAAVIRYRIYFFNDSKSPAVDVKLANRLDERTSFIASGVREPAGAVYDSKTGTIVITIPRLEPLEYYFVDYYVELAPDAE